jgi:hypothetical protein
VLYVDDKLATHPKIFKAGAMLGENGPALALAVYMAGLSYTREHLTDGRIPDRIVAGCALVQRPLVVARVLADRRVKLWHRVRGGYLIHDYHDWNKKASEIKEKRAAERKKKAAQRNGKHGTAQSLSLNVSPGDKSRTSCARASTIHVPRSTYHDPKSNPEVELGRKGQIDKQERAVASPPSADIRQVSLSTPLATDPALDGNYAVIVKIAHEALDELQITEPTADVMARVKDLCAERRIEYGGHPDITPDVVRKAVESAAAQRMLVPVQRTNRGGAPTSLGDMVSDFRARLDIMRARAKEA